MQEYANKEALVEAIQKTANLLLGEFDDVAQADLDLRLEGVDRTPREILAYQLGWMELMQGWDRDELAGKEVVTPAPGYKWNQMGVLYEGFYARHSAETLAQLKEQFADAVSELTGWIQNFFDDELFLPGGRKWDAVNPV